VRIVVSGTHASGKSTVVSDFALAHRRFQVLPDPFDLVDALDPDSAASFHEQLILSAERLTVLPWDADVIAERGPLDFLAYLEALESLGRASVSGPVLHELRAITADALGNVDVLAVLPLSGLEGVWVPDDEDPQLRRSMDERLLDLCDDDELVGQMGGIVELTGTPEERLTCLTTHLARNEEDLTDSARTPAVTRHGLTQLAAEHRHLGGDR
jgi:hypothetical protein